MGGNVLGAIEVDWSGNRLNRGGIVVQLKLGGEVVIFLPNRRSFDRGGTSPADVQWTPGFALISSPASRPLRLSQRRPTCAQRESDLIMVVGQISFSMPLLLFSPTLLRR